MQCTIDSCPKVADYTFVWPWGTAGSCCQGHVIVVQQKAKAARGRFGVVSFSRLDPDRVIPLSRDERVELQSTRLVAESERDDARTRATELFAVNTRLANEARAHKLRADQLTDKVSELVGRVDALLRERDEALVLASKTREEVEQAMMQQVEMLVSERTGTLEERVRLSENAREVLLRDVEMRRAEVQRVNVALEDALRDLAAARDEARERKTPTEGVHVVEGG